MLRGTDGPTGRAGEGARAVPDAAGRPGRRRGGRPDAAAALTPPTGSAPAPDDLPLRRAVAAMGGARGVLLASLPTVAYVVGDAFGGLPAGAAGGAVAGLVVLVERLRARQRTTPAVVGFLAVLGLVALALVTGRPEAFFLPAVVGLTAQSSGFLSASLVRHPVSGHVARMLGSVRAGWRDDAALVRLFRSQDVMWAGVFALRASVTAALALTGSVAGAGAFRLTGTPMYIALVALCVRWARPQLEARG